MKKCSVVLFGLLFLFPLAAFAEKTLGPEEFTSVDELAFAISSYFPKVQGEVKSLQGDRLTIGLGRKDGLQPGMVLSVWRDGKEILHPITKAVLGRAEDSVGMMEIVSVAESTATAVVKQKLKEPMIGDRARISLRKLNLGILPLRKERPEVFQGLIDRLKELGRFTVLDQQKVEAFLKDKKQRDTSLVRDLLTAQNLDAVAVVGIYLLEDKPLVMVQVFFSEDTKTSATLVAVLKLTSKREALGDVRPFFAPVKATMEKLPVLPVNARYFAVADPDGDGTLEYVFCDEAKLHIMRPEPSGWKEIWTETVPAAERGAQEFHLDLEDSNGNGKPEIYMTRMVNDRVSTVVVEYQEGGYRRIAETPGFLRILRRPGKGAILIGQDYDPATFYAGPVREYSWSGGKPTACQEVPLPKGINIFGFTFADFGEAHPLLVAFDRDNRLSVYSGDTVLWRSEERYVTVDTVVTKPLSGLDTAVGRTASDLDKAMGGSATLRDKDREVRIPGDILSVDLDGNGKDELVIPRNTPNMLIGGYKAGEVHTLAWTGSRLEPRWTVKDLDGAVIATHIVRQGSGPAKVVALIQVPGGLFSRDSYRLEHYEAK